MMAIDELRAWLSNLANTSSVAVDDGGLCLVEVDENGNETGYYIEVGGIPLPESAPTPNDLSTGVAPL